MVPCGQCVGCRLERSRQWAVRCVQEAQLHDENCFLTLTYSDKNLPAGGTLVKKHFQDFMKRLRKWCGKKIKYYHCGEYGESSRRPHYHALLFGVDFPDKVLFKKSADGSNIYTSAVLDRLWPAGFATSGAVTFESAAYVARYICKKVTGEHAKHFYDGREPEFATMSRRPGIGRGWLDQYANEVYPRDEVITRGFPGRPPRFYDQVLEDVDVLEAWKVRRARQESLRLEDQTEERLVVREKCALAKFNLYRSEVVL